MSKIFNFEQNIEHNRLKIKELPERKIGENKSKIGSSLAIAIASWILSFLILWFAPELKELYLAMKYGFEYAHQLIPQLNLIGLHL